MNRESIRTMLLTAMDAASFGVPIDSVKSAIARGEKVTLEQLDFDSLAWMEFCISVELQSKVELTTSHIEKMTTMQDIEGWLREKLEGV